MRNSKQLIILLVSICALTFLFKELKVSFNKLNQAFDVQYLRKYNIIMFVTRERFREAIEKIIAQLRGAESLFRSIDTGYINKCLISERVN